MEQIRFCTGQFALTLRNAVGIVPGVRTLLSSIVLIWGIAAPKAIEPVPDFQLLDHNPNSPRYGRSVSPRDYILQVTGYYFGDAG